VLRICPDLPISADVCLRIGGQKLAEILSVYTKKNSLAALRYGSSRRSPKPHVGPPMACACGARTLRLAPLAIVLDCGAKLWSLYV